MKIVVDVYGGDDHLEMIKGCIESLVEDKDLKLVMVGYEQPIKDELAKYKLDMSQIEIVNADEVVSNNEDAKVVLREKKNSSLGTALSLLKEDNSIDGMISAGHTGAVLTGAYMLIKRIDGVLRPALAPLLPTKTHGDVCLVDCGANIDCKPEFLAQFALMGSLYMQSMYGFETPRVALISNGTEDKKGNELTRGAFELIKQMPVNFCGNIEAREALSGNYDVLVTDGFDGNVFLKSVEGTASMLMSMLKEAIMNSASAKFGYLFMKKAFKQLKKDMDYNSRGGATLLGINKVLVKAHGSGNALAIKTAISQVKRMVNGNLVENIRAGLAQINATQTADSQ